MNGTNDFRVSSGASSRRSCSNDLRHSYGITDFSPLREMRLSWLNLCRTRMTDLSVLASLPLLHLDLRGTWTTDLLPLANVPLTSLDIRFTGIGDVSPLGRMPLAELSFHPSRIPKGFALLQENGYFVLRFLAEDVGKHLDHVLDAILRALVRRNGGSRGGSAPC